MPSDSAKRRQKAKSEAQRQAEQREEEAAANLACTNTDFTVTPLGEAVVEPKGRHMATILFLHGLGGSSADWELFRWALQSILGSVLSEQLRWISLDAPVRKVWGIDMPAWFRYKTDRSGKDAEDIIDENHLLQTRMQLFTIIGREAGRLASSGGAQRIFLVGSSQGGSAALDAALRWPLQPSLLPANSCTKSLDGGEASSALPCAPGPVGGVVMLRSLALSSSARAAKKLGSSEPDRQLKVLAVSGAEDNTFVLPLVRRQLARIKGVAVTRHEVIAGLDHETSIHVEEVRHTAAFMLQCLGLAADHIEDAAISKIIMDIPVGNKCWGDLSELQKNAAKALGISHRNTWDAGTAPVWSKSWRQLSVHQQRAAQRLGFEGKSWDAREQ